MLVLQECIIKLAGFKATFSQKYGMFSCEVDLVRFRDSLRPLFKSNILKDVIYV